MKKIIKFFKIALLSVIILMIAGFGVLYLVFPPSKVKNIAQEFVRKNYNREIDYDDLSLTLLGAKITDFKLSETSNFDNGTFVSAKRVVIKLDIMPLLKGNLQIKELLLDGISINVIREEDGKFNFDDFVSADKEVISEKGETGSANTSAFAFIAEVINLTDTAVTYIDRQEDMNFTVDKLNLTVKNFSLNEAFSFALGLQTSLRVGNSKINPLLVNLQGKANLADLNMEHASVDISPLSLAYRTAKISFNGEIKNFLNPVLSLDGKIEGVNDTIITSVTPMDLPSFALPPADLVIRADMDLEKQKATVKQADLLIGKSYIKNKADFDFSSDDVAYKLDTDLNLSLTDIHESAKEMLKEIAPKGGISGYIKAVSAKPYPQVKGKINFKNIGGILLKKELKNFNGEINISSIKDIRTNIMSGNYNNSSFKTSLVYTQPSKPINIDFMLDLDKFTLDDINFDEFFNNKDAENIKKSEQAGKNNTTFKTADFGTYNIKVDVKIKEVSNNVLTANNLLLKADLKNFSNDLSKLQGNLSFVSSNGEIRDIDKIMKSSKIMRAALAVVKVVKQVFSVAKLDGISLGKGDVIKYSEIEGIYTITNGMINLDKSSIVSNLLTVKASGTIDLVTEKLGMTVNTHFGKVTSGSAFKPVVLKIKGTMNEPKYSVDVLSTVTSIASVPGNVLKGGVKMSTNTASGVTNGIKGVASAIGKLF